MIEIIYYQDALTCIEKGTPFQCHNPAHHARDMMLSLGKNVRESQIHHYDSAGDLKIIFFRRGVLKQKGTNTFTYEI